MLRQESLSYRFKKSQMIEKLKSLSKQTLIYGTSTIVGRFLNFILVPFYTNVFTPSEYGIVAIIFAYLAFLNIFYSLGLESGYFRFASSLETGNEKQTFSHPFLTILFNSAFLSAIVLIFSGTLSGIAGLGVSIPSGIDSSIVTYSAFILFFDALAVVPFAYLRLKNKAKLFAAIKLINISVNVSLNIILILVLKQGLVSVFISNLIASAITLVILLPIILKNLSFSFNRKLFGELVKFSLPTLPAGLAALIVQVIDKPVTQYLTDIKTVGIYNANYKLGIFMMLIVSMFDYAWRPFFLNNAKEPNAKELFSKVMTVFIGGTSIVFILLTFFIGDLIKIPLPFKGHIIGEKYWSGVYIVPVVLLSYIFLGMCTNLVAGIYIEKKTKYLPYTTGISAIINIVFCFAFIPLIGIMGGAIATLASYVSMAIVTFIIVQKFYKVNYETGKIAGMILVNLIVLVIFYISYSLPALNSVFIKAILSIIFCGAVVWVSELWKVKKILKK